MMFAASTLGNNLAGPLAGNNLGDAASDIVRKGTRVSFRANAVGVFGIPALTVNSPALDAVAADLTAAYGYRQVVHSSSGSQMTIEATLNNDKISMAGVQNDFVSAVRKQAGFAWGSNNYYDITAFDTRVIDTPPASVPSRINDDDGGTGAGGILDTIGDTVKDIAKATNATPMLVGGAIALLIVLAIRR